MKLPEFISRFLPGNGEKSPEEPLREAAGVTVDADEDQWRKLTGDADRDLSPMTQQRMQKLAAWLWESNPLANRIIELPVAFLLAEGVKLASDDEDAQQTLNRFWRDPINRMAVKMSEKVRELALYGEQFYPAFVNERNGDVRLGYLDPSLVATVVVDPDNPSQPIGVVTVKDRKGRARRYKVIINGGEDVFTARTQEIRDTFDDGECFYFRVNNLAAGSRGRSDLLSAADWLDGYDQFLFGELDRAKFQRAFFYDVKLTGATPEQVKARARDITAPAPASVRVHNDTEEWTTETPDLKAGDSAEHARLFRNHVLGGQTIPEHWFGGGGDVNRNAASEMGEPTFKIFSMRQSLWKEFLQEIGCYVLRKAALAEGDGEPEFDDPAFQVNAVFPELVVRDTTKWAAALQQTAAALVIAIDRGLLTDETATKMLAVIAGRLGVEFDPAEEIQAAQAARSKQREEDAFTGDTNPAAVDEAEPPAAAA
ncbi:MAG: hypothetical protein Q7U97_14465 [Rhodocyclaceae bacterium]|nr:hypothetical protein [Rhodocyclaceae bacterium]